MKKIVISLFIATLSYFNTAIAFESVDNPWQIRLRAIGVVPQEDSTITAIGGEVDASDVIVPELDISYFFNKNIAAELILAVAPHDMNADATTAGNLDLGEVWLLPPTLTLQYHFYPNKKLKPYVGAGVNYTVFFNEKAGTGVNTIEYEDGFGFALQAGVDIPIKDNWSFNLDAKKIFLNTDVNINNNAIMADVDLDPLIIGAGITYKF